MAVFSRVAVAVPFVSALFTSVSAFYVNNTTQYDYVIVGGGLTGLIVANRLTEDKNSKQIYGHQRASSSVNENRRDCTCD